MYVSVCRYRGLIVAWFAAIAGWSVASACEDVAVLSTDARYFVLSGDTLQVMDVGNLWWLGIRGVGSVAPGSSLARAALRTDRRVNLQTGMWTGPSLAVASLQDLGRQLASASDLRLVISSSAYDSYRWVNDDPHDRLLRIHEDGDEFFVSLVRADLTTERQWRPPTIRLGSGVSCVVDERLFIGALETRLEVVDDELAVETIAGAQLPDEYRFIDRSHGCNVLAVPFDARPIAERPSTDVTGLLVDLSENEVVREFRYMRGARGLLFADGEKYLQQDITLTPADTGGYYVDYTGRVRVVDTRTSEILGETALEGSGEMSRLLCRNEAERVVLSDNEMVHLLDLDSLEIIATQTVPFVRYFVF